MYQRPRQIHAKSQEDVTDSIVNMLQYAEKPGVDLQRKLNEEVHASGWTWADIAQSIFEQFQALLKAGEPMGPALKDAYDGAVAAFQTAFGEIEKFENEHPYVFWSLIAVACMFSLSLSPWVLEYLGFGELGPIAGTSCPGFPSRCLLLLRLETRIGADVCAFALISFLCCCVAEDRIQGSRAARVIVLVLAAFWHDLASFTGLISLLTSKT